MSWPPGSYAHTPNEHGDWDDLAGHLRRVAQQARQFAAAFGLQPAESVAYLAGLFHDLGKVNPAFQAYLAACAQGRQRDRVPHARWGAAYLYNLLWRQQRRESWRDVALIVHGHHAGLAEPGRLAQDLDAFLDENQEAIAQMHGFLRRAFPQEAVRVPALTLGALEREVFIRMVFSAVVDADRLDTERHFDGPRAALRDSWLPLAEVWGRYQRNRESYLAARPIHHASAPAVQQVREAVYRACLQAAEGAPGLYRLTVPTGGGKTLSSLAFALKHAVTHHLRRVVVAIPYTSIIDQTAAVYRAVLGEDAVLEHHSQVPALTDEDQTPPHVRWRLAAENWAAPVIVTTTVQLFESLFANQPSAMRKLHRLARSVLVLDEAQTLPLEMLRPTLDVLRTLVRQFGVTLVLSTATQPAFEATPYLQEWGGLPVRDIVPEYPEHFRALQRVQYDWRREPLTWEALATEVKHHGQVLVVLNARRHAVALARALKGVPGVYHLSTLLCGAHRRQVLETVRARLARGEPVRLISTQVVEAGVDLDFPCVYRALAPLDRIVQAAGRCNREGRLDTGQVILFEPAASGVPHGSYQVGTDLARLHLSQLQDLDDLHQPDIYRAYFQALYQHAHPRLDARGIQRLRQAWDFPAVAQTYRIIADETVPVVVDYGDALARLARWRSRPARDTWAQLQRYLVNLSRRDANRLQARLQEEGHGLYRWCGDYDECFGLVGWDSDLASVLIDPADLIY